VNAITLSIYDNDPFGSDELIANQIIPLSYFKDHQTKNTKTDLWLKLNCLNIHDVQERVLVQTNVSLFQHLELPYFTEQIASESEVLNPSEKKIILNSSDIFIRYT